MSLSPDQIKALLAKPEKRGGRGKGGTKVNTSIRDYATWFKLAHSILDREDSTAQKCDNENCLDPRVDRSILLAEVNGMHMCRYCFLDGYAEVAPEQIAIES